MAAGSAISEQVLSAAAALLASRDDEALDDLLSAWRQSRYPALAALIEEVGAHVADLHPPLPGVLDADAHWPFRRLALEGPASAVSTLLSRFPAETWDRTEERVQWLRTIDADPRIATALVQVMRSATSWGFCPTLFEATWSGLAEIADPASIAKLEAIDFSMFGSERGGDLRRERDQCVSQIRATPNTVAPADLDDAIAVAARALESRAQAVATSPQHRIPALFSAVYADPDSDELRAILADQLLERGDPRGEFITLQLRPKRTREQSRRMNALLKEHRDTWLGPLRSAVLKAGLRFERGFLARATLPLWPARPVVATIGERAWSTVRELDANGGSGLEAALVTHPVMRSLRTLRGVRLETALEILANDTPLPLHSFDVDRVTLYQHEPLNLRDVRRIFAEARGTPDLKELTVREIAVADNISWLFDTDLGRRIERLRVAAPAARHYAPQRFGPPVCSGAGIRWLLDLEERPPTVVLAGDWSYEVTGQSLLIYPTNEGFPSMYETLIADLRTLERVPLTSLSIVIKRRRLPNADQHRAIRRVVGNIAVESEPVLPGFLDE